MAERLLNKVAVVTGAGGSLGRAIVGRFSGEGAKVVVFGRHRGRLEELASLAPARILVVEGDVTRRADLDNLVQTTVRRFGRADLLVPAAAAVSRAPLAECTPELMSGIFAVNVHGAHETVRAFLNEFNPGAAVVFVSVSPERSAMPGWGAYCASKAALRALARTLAVELAPRGIRVNCVAAAPPAASTAGRPPARLGGRPGDYSADVAEAVFFLAADAAPTLIGQEIVVDRPPASAD